LKAEGTGAVITGQRLNIQDLRVENGGIVEVTDSTINNGIYNSGRLVLGNGKVSTGGDDVVGILVKGGELTADNLSIVTTGDRAHGVEVNGGKVTLNDVEIAVNSADGIYTGWQNAARIEMDKGNITVNGPGGYGVHVIGNRKIEVALSDTNIVAFGADSYALIFENGYVDGSSTTMNASTATAAQSAVIQAIGGNRQRLDLADSTLDGDRLVQMETIYDANLGGYANTRLDMAADNSRLYGHVMVDSAHGAKHALLMSLDNNSTWTLRPSSAGIVHSDVAVLNIANSAIHFDPQTNGLYQTLAVGRNAPSPAVYNANNAEISLNTWLNVRWRAVQSADRPLADQR